MKVLVLLKVKVMVLGQVYFFVAKLRYNQYIQYGSIFFYLPEWIQMIVSIPAVPSIKIHVLN